MSRGAQVVNMPLQQFRALYREYINAFAACLLELASDPESPVLPRLERLVGTLAAISVCGDCSSDPLDHNCH
jgi:hypothetical protein